ncbi:MAG: ATP-binding protein [Parachlamydiales bacterium]
MYYTRDLEPLIEEALEQFPVLLITGPRQAGKSTLLQQRFARYRYVSLDRPDQQQAAQEDPELFLRHHPPPCVIDEIQYAPMLLPYIKVAVDRDRHNYGQYILTGSQIFQLMQGVTESLAGRCAIFDLYPFSWREVKRMPNHQGEDPEELSALDRMVEGFYPEFFHHSDLDKNRWFNSYVATYLERDVRNIQSVVDLARFRTFLGLLAARAGKLLNLSEIAKECGISQPTAKSWLTILEATYIVYLLRPYYKNHSKRLVKSPKLYFVDTGLLCHLLGIESSRQLTGRGEIFENMVVMEQIKQGASNRGLATFSFYRTHDGVEVDLIRESGGNLDAWEIKFSSAVNRKMVGGLSRFLDDHPEARGKVLCLRQDSLPLTDRIVAVNWGV